MNVLEQVKPAAKRTGPRRESLRVLQKKETLQLLIKAANHLFLKKGYAQTTIEEIASRAGASRATFYLHFARKWQVLRQIAEDTILPESLEYYRRLDSMGVPTREELRAWLIDAIGFFERHKKFLDVYREAKSIEPEIGRHNIDFLRRCVDQMPHYLARWGTEREAYAKLRLNMLTIQLDDASSLAMGGDPDVNRELVAEALLEYWTVGLKAPADGRDDGRSVPRCQHTSLDRAS